MLAASAGQLGVDSLGPVLAFGFSGGAQFLHRFTLMHPRRVARQVLVASGYYTMPDLDTQYPYGLGPGRSRDRALESTGFTVPTRVMVGEGDTQRDRELRTGDALDHQQGRHRLERALRFVLATRALAGARRRSSDCSIELLRGCGHSFGECVRAGGLAEKAVSFLTAPGAGESA